MKQPENNEGVINYARLCSVTGEGMNDGWVVDTELKYFKYEADALAYAIKLGYTNIEDAFDHDVMYYTEWEIENEMYYYAIDKDGNVTEINHWDDEDDQSLTQTNQ